MLPQISSSNFIEHNGRLWMTAEMLGAHLGYAEPRKSIVNIYDRNKRQLSYFSSVIKMMSQGQARSFRVFDEDGCMIIAMKANTPTAEKFQEALAKFVNHIRREQAAYLHTQEKYLRLRTELAKLELQKYLSSHGWKQKDLRRIKQLRPYLSILELAKLYNTTDNVMSRLMQRIRYAEGDFGNYQPKQLRMHKEADDE